MKIKSPSKMRSLITKNDTFREISKHPSSILTQSAFNTSLYTLYRTRLKKQVELPCDTFLKPLLMQNNEKNLNQTKFFLKNTFFKRTLKKFIHACLRYVCTSFNQVTQLLIFNERNEAVKN